MVRGSIASTSMSSKHVSMLFYAHNAHVHRVLTWADHISGDGVLTTQEFQRGLKARGLSLGSRAMSELMRVRHHMLLLL
jgi:hypothetical protein